MEHETKLRRAFFVMCSMLCVMCIYSLKISSNFLSKSTGLSFSAFFSLLSDNRGLMPESFSDVNNGFLFLRSFIIFIGFLMSMKNKKAIIHIRKGFGH